MGLDIVYSSGGNKYKWPLSMNEFEALNILAKKDLGEFVEPLLGVEDFGKKAYVEKGLLIQAIDNLYDKINQEPGILPGLYDAQIEIPRGSGNYSKGGQGVCGLEINNEQYDLEHGFDLCCIRKKWIDQDGKIQIGEPIDIRDHSEIKTDTNSFFGDVKIIKKSISKSLLRKLTILKDFIETCEDHKIFKLLG